MRHITDEGLQLIKQFEGFAPTPYLCPAGYLTVGYGHVVKKYENFDHPITEQDALTILGLDVQVAEHVVLRLINVPLTDGQHDALVSFTFNLGSGALQRSTLRRKINRQEYEDAVLEFGKWVWASGKKLKGLIRRRQAEAVRFQS